MEQTNVQQRTGKIKRGPAHEGPKNHFIAFAISIALTFLAFVAVANPNLSNMFKVWFIIILAFVQVVVQLSYWMHMKDRGHGFARVGLAFGFVIFLCYLVTVVYWTWW